MQAELYISVDQFYAYSTHACMLVTTSCLSLKMPGRAPALSCVATLQWSLKVAFVAHDNSNIWMKNILG